MSDKKWYVVHTYSGHENKVKTNLEKAIHANGLEEDFGKILVLTEQVVEMKDGKRSKSTRKMFPSYVYVEMNYTNETGFLVQNVPGVTGFVGPGKKPVPLKDAEVRRLINSDVGAPVKTEAPVVTFKVGDSVKITDGPFSAFTGVVDNIEGAKVKVMVSIFGRATPVELDVMQVDPV
ncbi:MAG: transcription termination/antitermination protein NusG [Candidatus Eisenbacteria bacterium]|jgi:transcriptional antiterminator NusG|nr:transcription termination/antitermination protein NusG [Candidatus Eisenbacteria bacterium]